MYLESNLNKIKNKFFDIHNKYPRFLQYIANKENENINYEILSNKVDDINSYDKYNTLYSYLSEFNLEKTSIKDKLFLEALLKGFNLKKGYTKNVKNNIEKAYDDLFLSNKKINNIFYIKAKNERHDKNKNIF